MESTYTAKEGQSLSIVQDICGHPKPVVQWKLNEDMFVSSLKSTLINDTMKQYRYSYESRSLRRSDCGKYITVNASNEVAAIEQNAMIDVVFKPSPVSINSMYRINESCLYMGWLGESAENCSVKYYFQFDGEHSRHEISAMNFVHCGLQNARSVVFWASYKNIIGKKTNALLVYENISPLMKKSNKDEEEGQCSNKITIVIIVTVIAALTSNIIIICVCIKSAGTCNIKQACRKQKETNKIENKYDTVRKFSNCQDVKKGAKKMDVQNEYAEIALNLMEKNIYYAPAQT
ncbi:uncharacterized protein LOC130635739 [Hydractinia symbiolongicarpus]|uniref:uncharacterized protein LOC130635739 n=1 Tax=Hydractinia symbiolongicarpus TaxID=13093 RepID=UPI00254DE542|nr:uncharacterized protein LOC130635739 [Hydractinia symbiolongicarpus]